MLPINMLHGDDDSIPAVRSSKHWQAIVDGKLPVPEYVHYTYPASGSMHNNDNNPFLTRGSLFHVLDIWAGELQSTYTDCAYQHAEAFQKDSLQRIKQVPVAFHVFTEAYPAGTPLSIRYLNTSVEATSDSGRANHRHHGVVSTQPVSKAAMFQAYERMREYEFRHVLPRLGKSVNKHSFPTGAIMTLEVEGHRVPYTCPTVHTDGTKCTGHYIADNGGFYYCTECGLIYTWQADEVNARKVSSFDQLASEAYEAGEFTGFDEYEVSEGVPEDAVEITIDDAMVYITEYNFTGERTNFDSFIVGKNKLGGQTPAEFRDADGRISQWEDSVEAEFFYSINAGMAMFEPYDTLPESGLTLESVYAQHKADWLTMVSEAPVDEVKAKSKNHNKAETTRKVKSIMRKDSVYKSRINESKQNDRKVRLLALIRAEGQCNIAKLAELTGMHRTAINRVLASMVADGKVIATKSGRDNLYQVV